MRNSLDGCLKQFVCVQAKGVRYFGTLIEVGEEEIYLRTQGRWITIAVDTVSSIRPVSPEELEQAPVEEVDAAAYEPTAVSGGEIDGENDPGDLFDESFANSDGENQLP